MNMKLSYRDKVIFVVVIVIIVLAVGFFVFVKAKIQESQDVQANLAVKQQELDEVHAKIETLDGLKTRLKDTIKEVDELQEDFLDEKVNYEVDQYLSELLSEIPGLQLKGMAITGEQTGDLSAYFYTKNSTAYDIKMNADLSGDSLPQEVYDNYYKTAPSAPESATVALTEVEITMNVGAENDGVVDWDVILAAFDAVSSHDKTIYLKSFEAGDAQGDAESAFNSEVVMVVDVFSIYHMDTSKAE